MSDAAISTLPSQIQEMTNTFNRSVFHGLRWPAYSFLLMTAAFQVADFILGATPAHPELVTWRFGLTGIAANSVGNLLLLVLLAFMIALVAGDRIVLQLVGIAGGLIAVLLLIGAVSFGLDSVQLRPRSDSQAAQRFAVVAGMALIKLVAESVLALFFAITALRASGDVKRDDDRKVRAGGDARFLIKTPATRVE
jgi:hypothetical protein